MAGNTANGISGIERQLEHEFFSCHPAAAADALELLDTADQVAILERQPVARTPAVWERVSHRR